MRKQEQSETRGLAMRMLMTGICLLALSPLAHAEEISSVYTELNVDQGLHDLRHE